MSGRSSKQSFAVSGNSQNAKNHFIEPKIYRNIRISDTASNSVSTSTWLRVVSNMKSSSHKTWQTPHSFLKPHQIQNLNRKIWGDMAYYVPTIWKSGVHVPRVTHLIALMHHTTRRHSQNRICPNVSHLITEVKKAHSFTTIMCLMYCALLALQWKAQSQLYLRVR